MLFIAYNFLMELQRRINYSRFKKAYYNYNYIYFNIITTYASSYTISKFYNLPQYRNTLIAIYYYYYLRNFCIILGTFFSVIFFKNECRREYWVSYKYNSVSYYNTVLFSLLYKLKSVKDIELTNNASCSSITMVQNLKINSFVLVTFWKEKKLKKILKGPFFLFIDFFFFYINTKFFKKKNYNMSNCGFKLKSFNGSIFFFKNNFNSLSKNQLFLLGLNSFWKHLRFWLLPISITIMFLYYTFFLKSLPFMKILFSYFLIVNMFYLLVSGFIFFFKKYQYRLYTTSIQRFWRRSLIIFWLIEVSLFIVFIYLTLNASQEPIHVYDNIQIYKTHFYSWRYFLIKIIPSTLIIIFVYILLLFNKWNTFSKVNSIVCCITFLLFFIFWLEFYQIFYLLTRYGVTEWVYDIAAHLWNLETDFKRTRIVNHYVTICLIAKFWHIVFAVLFWIFFVLRGLESSRYRYPLLVSNLQNFLLIYIMSWLYMYPWFKYVFRKILDLHYYWFFLNNRKLGFFIFFNDIKLFYWGFLDLFYNYSDKYKVLFNQNVFHYLYQSTYSNTFMSNTQFRKHHIRDFFVSKYN